MLSGYQRLEGRKTPRLEFSQKLLNGAKVDCIIKKILHNRAQSLMLSHCEMLQRIFLFGDR